MKAPKIALIAAAMVMGQAVVSFPETHDIPASSSSTCADFRNDVPTKPGEDLGLTITKDGFTFQVVDPNRGGDGQDIGHKIARPPDGRGRSMLHIKGRGLEIKFPRPVKAFSIEFLVVGYDVTVQARDEHGNVLETHTISQKPHRTVDNLVIVRDDPPIAGLLLSGGSNESWLSFVCVPSPG